MATITFGGGPSEAQRREFAGLKEGAHVPGYRGYCPQIKYRVGKTYGNDTHELAKDLGKSGPIASLVPHIKPPPQNPLPQSTGDNKYTENMIPGYTGYIPRFPFKFGGTYKEDCDVCIDDFLTSRNNYSQKEIDLRRSAKSFPTLQAISRDPYVRDHLNTYVDNIPGKTIMAESKRPMTEPPMPGYKGYIPRIYTTEQGLGCRYHQMTKNGQDTFRAEQELYRHNQTQPISLERSTGGGLGPSYSRRLYPNDGMIPKYTGYVPRRRYVFGNTYGDTTRTLEVCYHDKNCFGDYLKTKPRVVQSLM